MTFKYIQLPSDLISISLFQAGILFLGNEFFKQLRRTIFPWLKFLSVYLSVYFIISGFVVINLCIGYFSNNEFYSGDICYSIFISAILILLNFLTFFYVTYRHFSPSPHRT